MASTNKTDNLNLSQFVDTDKPTWLSDYNEDMRKIDENVMTTRNYDSTGSVEQAGGIVDYVNENSNNYAKEETVIGTWINGKPLYRKVVYFGALPNATSKSVAHGISNLDIATRLYGATITSAKTVNPLPYVATTLDRMIMLSTRRLTHIPRV